MMRQEKGVTLGELVVTVSIIAILALIAIPNYVSYYPKARVNAAGRELFTELQWARMRAIADNNDYVVEFDTSNNTYTIYDDDDGDGEESGEEVKTVSISKHTGIEYGYIAGNNPSGSPITSEVTFSGDKVTFRPTGLSNKNGAVYLIPTDDTAVSRKDRQRCVTVLLSGRIRLYRHTGTGHVWD